MKNLFLLIFLLLSIFTKPLYGEVKIGIVLDFTGPIMSLTPAMASSANLAFEEASESGSFLGGQTIKTIKADTKCVDSTGATVSTNKIIKQGIVAIVGSACPKITEEILINSAIPNKIIMVSPAATSLRLTNFNNNGYFFRTVPSDIRDGQILADITKDKKIKSLAITYANNYYGKSLSDAYKSAVEAYGIKITAITPHEDNKTDYSTESSYLASAGGDALAIIGYQDKGGKGIIQASLDSGAFDIFILSDQMIGQTLVDSFGKSLEKSFGFKHGSTKKGASLFTKIANENKIDSLNPFTNESYDAAALLVLSMQAANSTDASIFKDNILEIANSPGTKIYPGEIKKGLELLSRGKKINYEGATGVTLLNNGDAKGSFLEVKVKGNRFKTIKQR